MRQFRVLLAIITLSFSSSAQQLVINEISQGTGAKEYVEFVVIGTPTCQTPIPCIDLRGVVIDDNNGDFAAGSGTGIASGAVRFANIPFWSCIPQGTLILVYNESDINPLIPPIDLSMTDGNCRLIIPINSTLFEGQSTSPTSGIATYPATGLWTAGSGAWNQVAMSNTNDSFQIRQNNTSTSATHAVSWGNNNQNTQIYFTTASGNVFSMSNVSNNNPFIQSNWTLGSVGSNETPGAANNAANDVWIGSMNPNCGMTNSVQLTMSSTSTGCGGSCSGTATVGISGGTAPYQITWSNGGTTSTISNLCAGTYTVNVTDAGGCTITDQVTVTNGSSSLSVQVNTTAESCQGACNGSASTVVTNGNGNLSYTWTNGATSTTLSNLCAGPIGVTVTDQSGCSGTASGTIVAGNPAPSATIDAAGPFTTTDLPFTMNATSSGGTWTASCGTCINASSGVFNPQTAGAGTYQICYSVGTGVCADNDCVSITVTQGCITQQTFTDTTLCSGNSLSFNGNTLTTAGSYPVTFTAQNGCDSIFTLNLSFFNQTVSNDVFYLCLGDSILVDGIYYSQPDVVQIPMMDGNNCPYIATKTILAEDCSIDDFEVFVPNAFTPNGDGTNDLFTVVISGGTLLEGFIVNRWGNLIKEFSATDLNWDGTTQSGEHVQDGVYTYVLRVQKTDGVAKYIQGFVTVFK